jgi:hypothetical protein
VDHAFDLRGGFVLNGVADPAQPKRAKRFNLALVGAVS